MSMWLLLGIAVPLMSALCWTLERAASFCFSFFTPTKTTFDFSLLAFLGSSRHRQPFAFCASLPKNTHNTPS